MVLSMVLMCHLRITFAISRILDADGALLLLIIYLVGWAEHHTNAVEENVAQPLAPYCLAAKQILRKMRKNLQ